MAQRTDYWREFWLCTICGATNTRDDTVGLDHYEPGQNEREADPCQSCGATWRQRAVVVAVLHGLASLSGPLRSREHDHSVRGLGISDDVRTAAALAHAFCYVNTDLHRFPTLDIGISLALSERFDFVTCSEVLEHVLPPPERALANIKELLAEGGFAVLTVPIGENGFEEHYPDIVSWESVGSSVEWVDQSGHLFQDDAPVFHG
jgi:SAM-dependent methyltransferase